MLVYYHMHIRIFRNTYRHDLQHSTRRQHANSKAASPAAVPNKNMSHLGTAKTIKYVL
jgi:hypothetical protein